MAGCTHCNRNAACCPAFGRRIAESDFQRFLDGDAVSLRLVHAVPNLVDIDCEAAANHALITARNGIRQYSSMTCAASLLRANALCHQGLPQRRELGRIRESNRIAGADNAEFVEYEAGIGKAGSVRVLSVQLHE